MKKRSTNINVRLISYAQKGKWQNILVKIITSELFWLLIICGIFRLIFYSCLLNSSSSTDSTSYLNYNANILLGQVESFRTPGYPYFIKLIKFFNAENFIQNIIISQSLISFLSIILFYKTLNAVFKKRTIIFLTSLTYGIMPAIINFDKCIMTESISISATVLFLYFMVTYLRKPTILKAVLYTVYVFFLIMLRPSFIILFYLLFLFWILRIIFNKVDFKIALSGIAASFVCALLLFGYSQLNYYNNGFRGISIVSNFNQLHIIIYSNVYVDKKDPEISEKINSFMNKNDPVMTDALLCSFNNRDAHDAKVSQTIKDLQQSEKARDARMFVMENYSQSRIEKFILNCIIQHPVIYLKELIKKIASYRRLPAASFYANTKGGLSKGFAFIVFELLSFPFIYIYLLLLFDCSFIIILLVKSKQMPWFKILLWSFITAQLAISIIGAERDPHRIFVTALPFVIILFFSYIDMIFYSIDKDKLVRYSKSYFDKQHNI
ncbi:MAG: hypothetical protein M0R16_12995 [Bacteroidales bacterium]|jgi:hypothetical protein|nr:hypothetical protein [Bacteroidales bacterium]